MYPGAVSETRARRSKQSAHCRDCTAGVGESPPVESRLEASADAKAAACVHTAGRNLSTCLRCLVTSDCIAWITRLTALPRGA